MRECKDVRGGGVGKEGVQEWYLSFSSKIMDLKSAFSISSKRFLSLIADTNIFCVTDTPYIRYKIDVYRVVYSTI